MITSIKFISDYRCFKIGDHFDIQPSTILVGDQGCGKSTLLDLFTQKIMRDTIRVEGAPQKNFKAFNTEKDNPRTKDPHLLENNLFGFGITSRFASHGEVMLPVLKAVDSTDSDTLLLIDEPESGLSMRSVFEIINTLRELESRGVQFLVATHHPFIIEEFGTVLSLEHKRWMNADEFTETQKERV